MRARWSWIAFRAIALGVLGTAVVLLFGGDTDTAPGEEAPWVVVLDAGHGGRDPGAVYGGIREADINLAVMKRVAELIEVDDRLEVRTTRSSDITATLEERIALANDADAALYLSIQSNASIHPEASGVETLLSNSVPLDLAARRFAESLQDAVIHATGARDRGIRSQDLYLHRAEMPAALIEIGFLSNDAERARLLDSGYQDLVARAIYEGIVAYLDNANGIPPIP
jgi:N-acetylmuramoyl-L-alanine amidase